MNAESLHPPDRWSRTGQQVLAVLLVLKICLMAVNAVRYVPQEQHDAEHHMFRLMTCGLITDAQQYNPATYYILAMPVVAAANFYLVRRELGDVSWSNLSLEQIKQVRRDNNEWLLDAMWGPAMTYMRFVNVILMTGTYLLWLFVIFPKLLPKPRDSFLAGLLLLALPGFQRIAVQVHPDNLLILATTLGFAAWIKYSARPRPRLKNSAVMAAAVGLIGMTRPLAVWPVLFFGALGALKTWRDLAPAKSWRFSTPKLKGLLLFGLISATMSVSWWTYRYAVSDTVLNAHDPAYMQRFRERKKEFDYLSFYTSLPLAALFKSPNRHMGVLHDKEQNWKNNLNNSFFPVFFSDFWGDHWLYFSGPKMVEKKAPFKRALFALALPATILFTLGFITTFFRLLRNKTKDRTDLLNLAACACAIGGFLTFALWQGTDGLLPGKQGTIKFLYFANIAPFFIPGAILFLAKSKTLARIAPYLIAALFTLALPLALYWR